MNELNEWSEQRSEQQASLNLSSSKVEDNANQKLGKKAKSNTKGFGSKS